MFRSLIYRTDVGNTIVREDPSPTPVLNPNEANLFTDFVIPANQPLYLWRVTGGTNVVPNTQENIDDWIAIEFPPSPEDDVSLGEFTGYTATTQVELDGKINTVTGASGNVGTFDPSGNLVNSGFSIDDLTGGTTGNTVSLETFTGYTATTETRLQDIETDITTLSAATDVLFSATTANAIAIGQNTTDIISISGATSGNTADIQYISGVTSGNTQAIADNAADIQFLSGETSGNTQAIADNDADIAFISGVTDTKQDQLTAGEGINSAQLAAAILELDLTSFTAIGGFNISITGTTDAFITDNRATTRGIQYVGVNVEDFVTDSLITKGYADAIVSGLDLKESVRVATTTGQTDIDITGGTFLGVVDGVTLQDGWRVLIKNQDSARQDNGIYVWSSGSSTFGRAVDFVDPNVTSGAFTFVETGTTNAGSGWVLVTQDPINIGTTELTFTQFSSMGSITAGVGIDITNGVISFDGAAVAGDSISWSGTQLDIDISTGNTLGDALADKLEVSLFNSYTGATETRLQGIESDIVFISGATSGNTQAIADNDADIAFISGVTDTKVDQTDFDAYTASTDASLSGFTADIQFLSGQTSGNTQAIADNAADIAFISGVTSGNTQGIADNAADIAFISGVTDTKTDQSDFTGFTASTTADIAYISGITDTKVDQTDFNSYTASTEADISFISGVTDTKLDTSIFTGYTASTQSNELYLVHTGGTNLNTITSTAVVWNSGATIGSAFSWTGGSGIFIQEAGDYEVSYNIPLIQNGNNNDRSIGLNIVKNNTLIIDETAASANSSRGGSVLSGTLSTVNLSLEVNDRLDLFGFRAAQNGDTPTSANGTILIKKKGTLQ